MRLFLLLAMLIIQPVLAADDVMTFPDETLRLRYQSLTEELRCPKCQNQNLADSNSMISVDLRNEVYRLLLDGQSDQQIKSHLVERYGDFVLYNPPVKSSTWVLWVLPVLLFVVALGVPLLLVKRQRNQRQQQLVHADRERLDALLSDMDSNS